MVDRGQFVPGRERDDQLAMTLRRGTRRHDQTSIRSAREGRDGALDLAGVTDVDREHLHPDRWRHGLNDAELGGAGGWAGIPKYSHARHAWRDLLEKRQPFSAQAVFEKHETG